MVILYKCNSRLFTNQEILPYFGSASYLYQRMPMGLNMPLAIW